VRLVRLAMELQGELDAQEDHDRWTLQLHLLLECAAMPKLHHAVHDAIADCPSEAQRHASIHDAIADCPSEAQRHASKALSAFGEDAHRHSLNFDADRRFRSSLLIDFAVSRRGSMPFLADRRFRSSLVMGFMDFAISRKRVEDTERFS